MQCYYGTDGYPGHCSNGTCSAREDIPPYYYNMSPHWTLGDQWKSAVVALLVTGSIAIAALIGRTQLKKLYHFIKTKIDAYRGRIAARDNIRNNLLPYIWSEQLWNEQHEQQQRWWSQVPGMHWVYNKLKRNQIEQPQYHPLDDRGDVSQTVALTEEPPPYRED
ncbi:hypothetical protein BDF20DRAFT_816883 [Mycotypha africana]|uniref:uncharacterized protein n=1 Tax=Mycotypha africana TaxID=64632 RepID=UPI002300A06F|nr:uncharacterized protein BDF20DRAFT_816883 [Mycotypha africana]KAI8984188.1 hypothetical protein BDF20DRAFT_816883 [Mycotypha africana]